MGRAQQLAVKVGLPVVALIAALGLSAAVAATYLTITEESGVGEFSPATLPDRTTTSTSTSTTLAVAAPVTETTVATVPTAPSTTVAGTRPRVTTTTARASTATTVDDHGGDTTTTTACANSGKGNCRSRGGPPDDD